MKVKRHAKIKEIIETGVIETQEDLANALSSEGIAVTQATVSRDIKELMLVKVPDAQGRYRYALPTVQAQPIPSERITRVFRESVIAVLPSMCMVVLRTHPGTASAVGFAVDYMHWEEVLGSIAGDDTVFVATADQKGVECLLQHLKEYTL